MISMIRYPVTTLGPGKRIGIWTAGCHKNCKGCMSGYAKEFNKDLDRPVSSILEEIKSYIDKEQVDGITISGGEPFDQEDLEELLIGIDSLGVCDVLVYTGYCLKELDKHFSLLKYIGVLIDGPYIEELNDNGALRGSSNQTVYIVDSRLKESYNAFLKRPRECVTVIEGNKKITVGLKPKI
jgi:anaerobic ribonucleoside-triphosphate reductase activating protein